MEVLEERSFLWILKDVIDPPSANDINVSCSEFRLESCHESEWQITLEHYENHKDIQPFTAVAVPAGWLESDGWLELCIKLVKCSICLEASLSVCILDNQMNRRFEKSASQNFHVARKNCLNFREFLPLEELLRLRKIFFHNGDLIILGTLTIFQEEVKNVYSDLLIESHFVKNLRSLLQSGAHADFIIKVKDDEFNCHKPILASRCLYFDCLLRNDLREKRSNVLILQDIEPGVFEQVLVYIYTNEPDISESNVFSLLVAAEKYMLSGLKEKCVAKLFKYSSFLNLPSICAVADAFQLNNLKLRLYHMYAMFQKQIKDNIQCNTLKNITIILPSAEEAVACNNKSTSSFNFKTCDFPILPVKERSFFPSVAVWAATYCSVILDCKKRLIQTHDRLPQNLNLDKLQSFKFSYTNAKCKISFEICYCFCSCNKDLILYAKLVASEEKVIRMHFRISLVSRSGIEGHRKLFSSPFEAGEHLCVYYLSLSNAEGYFHNGDLILNCKAWIDESNAHYLTNIDHKNNLLENMASMYTNAAFTDLVIKVKETEFQCHKSILSCRSPILAQMLETDINDAVLEVKDIEPDVFKKILTYIYTDEYELDEALAFNDLALATQFQLEHLKSMCERCLTFRLNEENAVEMLNSSINNSATTLQKRCLKFVREFLHKILANPQSVCLLQRYNLSTVVFSGTDDDYACCKRKKIV